MAHDDEDLTPPRGGAKRNTRYSQIDDRGLLERAADNAQQARIEVRKLREDWEILTRPYARPWHERVAPAALAVIIFMWFVAWTMHSTSATVPEPPRAQALR